MGVGAGSHRALEEGGKALLSLEVWTFTVDCIVCQSVQFCCIRLLAGRARWRFGGWSGVAAVVVLFVGTLALMAGVCFRILVVGS